MNRRCIAFSLSLFTAFAWQHAYAQLPGSSPFEAAPVGKTVAGIIECGSSYEGNESYDVKITIMELVRGEAGVREIVADLPQAPDGRDYVLARINFEYLARGRPGDCIHSVSFSHFTPLAMSGDIYEPATISLPGPELEGPINSGQAREGWTAFLVAADDPEPLLTFSVDDSGAVQHGGKLWFKLY